MNKLLKIFQGRYAGIICFLFAITNRIIFITLNSLIGTDTKIQLTYTENLLAGKGMGVMKYFTSDLNNPVFDTQQFYPPGLSIIIIPFLKLFGGDEYRAILAFDLIVSVLFVIAIRALGKKASLSPALNNISTVVAGCVQYIFFMSWSSTDAISLCFVLFAFIQTIDIINKKENIGLLQTIGCALLFCLPFFFRYMYLPIAGFLPFAILFFGFVLKNKNLKIAGGKLLLTTICFLSAQFAFSLSASGNALFVQDFGRGIFIDQLSKWYPFLPASFINLDFAAQLIEKLVSISYGSVMFGAEIINAILFVVLLAMLFKYLVTYKKNRQLPHHFLFISIGSFIGVMIILLLAYLTLTYKALPWGFIRWTHAQHARYFAFIYAFIPLLLFVCIQHYGHLIKRYYVKLLIFFALCLLATEVLHGIYYNIKIVINHKDLSIIKDADKGYKNLPAIVAEIKKQHPDRQVFISSPDQYYLHAASNVGCKAIFDYENLWRSNLRVPSKSILLMPVHEQEAVIMKDYIEKKKPQLLSTIAGTYFYIEEIDPQ
jgi:hypothetical protein